MPARREIVVTGARQNNLKDVSVKVPVGAVTAVTGVAGAGKSSLAFDVLYAEGHRRYAETFSPYARQFLERLDRPDAESIEGVLPAVAVDRTAPVRTSRSTVGTMTSVADYTRALWARSATLHCRKCGRPVVRDTPSTIFAAALEAAEGRTALIAFPHGVGAKVTPAVVREAFEKAGFRRVLEGGSAVRIEEAALRPEKGVVTVVLDRTPLAPDRRQRVIDSLEAALRWGAGHVELHPEGGAPLRFSEHLHCAPCDVEYADPTPALFSFNHPVGACETCRGFGRTMEIDPALVVPDSRLSLAEGCVKPFQTKFYGECQRDLMRFARRRRLPADVPWGELPADVQAFVWEGEEGGREDWQRRWYGIAGFFEWLESRTYRMHVRVFLSRYRRYGPCPDCRGARLRPEALLFRIEGRSLPDVEAMPVGEACAFFEAWSPPASDPAAGLLHGEIRSRLRFLVDVGLGYLTLSRQSRTLSGGEAQRVTLATALGGSLTSTLYVLDEPSVGLHPRDAGRLSAVLRRLAAAGNAVVVVEHDPELIAAADRVIDLGPGPGREGGAVVYEGPLPGLLRRRGSRTGDVLAGRVRVPAPDARRTPVAGRALVVRGARENNLKRIDVRIPLGLLVCVTGVSGSGKSSLVDQVLHRNLRRHFGRGESEPGACDGVSGAEALGGVTLVDQSPLGASSRVNAATYTGVLAALRKLYAATPDAKERGLTASSFSFNSKAGACPNCEGAGFEKVEMQFLPDAFVKCPACDGRRYRHEVLEVRCRGLDLASLLERPAADVARIFGDVAAVRRALEPLLEIGLGYLALSQPAPTLSGGEAQRLKLATALASAAKDPGHHLYLLDEPTTGLHGADVAQLVGALQRLVDAGHSVVVVEHHMDVARAADHVIDLGPEGGDAGGRIAGKGTPEAVAGLDTPTGRALRAALKGGARKLPVRKGPKAKGRARRDAIRIRGAREHNLQHVAVEIPRERLVAVTGVSGSGKSTLAFDVLFAEGQRRFLDCLSTYVRQFIRPLARPEVDRIEGVPPTVALEQKLSRGGALSTAGTVSEVYHHLRLLYARVGAVHCPRCRMPGRVVSAAGLAERIGEDFAGRPVSVLAPLVRRRKGFHAGVIATAARRGVERVRIDGRFHDAAKPPRIDRYRIHDVDALVAELPRGSRRGERLERAVERALELGRGVLSARGERGDERLYSTRRACPGCGTGLPAPDPRLFSWSQRYGACPRCDGFGVEGRDQEERRADGRPCRACGGTRLRSEALAVRIGGRHIGEVSALSVREAAGWVGGLRGDLPPEVVDRVLPELTTRLELLDRLGLGYLGLDRGSATLSTGEAQRIRIVGQLASNLRGVCYVLDEPTVGLHPRDSEALGEALIGLRERGNTVVVVEHDEPLIRRADHVVDLGPGAGPHGGRVTGVGTPKALARRPASVTGTWLRGGGERPSWPRRALKSAPRLEVVGARLHNLRDLSVGFPLGRLSVVTGVSGSGKSTLVRDVLHRAVEARLAGKRLPPELRALRGVSELKRALEVDETPIGRTPRSVPATYVGIMDAIRGLYAATPDARALGYGKGRFSFNVGGGRCERCEGQGRLRVTMALLPDVHIPCETCAGRRYNADTLAVTFKGRSIAELLAMTVEEALDLLAAIPSVRPPLEFLRDVGLGYLRLGQPSPTLSGGEAQRIKLAAELAAPASGASLYVLDEPTTGLHMADVAKLVKALHALVERGDTVVVIEHDTDLIAAADCVIDLGPEGGEAGGRVVVQGPPERVARSKRSRTAPYLARALAGPGAARRQERSAKRSAARRSPR